MISISIVFQFKDDWKFLGCIKALIVFCYELSFFSFCCLLLDYWILLQCLKLKIFLWLCLNIFMPVLAKHLKFYRANWSYFPFMVPGLYLYKNSHVFPSRTFCVNEHSFIYNSVLLSWILSILRKKVSYIQTSQCQYSHKNSQKLFLFTCS